MKKTVCVIDDDVIYQIIIKKIIEKVGLFEPVQCYSNGSIALREFERSGNTLPGLILLDINMPEIDGWQFIELLKSSHPKLVMETKIYIITSSIAVTDRRKAAGIEEVSGFISKPLTVDRLSEIGLSL